MKITTINGANVFILDDNWSQFALVSLAVNSDNFRIEHEQDANYGQKTIYTLNDGLWATVREIEEHQIEDEDLGDRFGLAFVQTVDTDFGPSDRADIVRFWKVEAFEDEDSEAA